MQNGFVVLDRMRNNKMYDGSFPKFGITVDGQDYIVKLSKDKESDYPVYCEYAASKFMRLFGIEAHEVWVGTYNGHLCDIIKDFVPKGWVLHTYADTKSSSEDTSVSGKHYTYSDVWHMVNKHTKLTREQRISALQRFWYMLCFDAVLGNRDRHPGNWGYLVPLDGGTYMPAPVYDNGSSLFPGLWKVIGDYKGFDFVWERSEYFPASVFQTEEGKKSNYYEIFETAHVPYDLRDKSPEYVRCLAMESLDIVSEPYKHVLCDIIVCRYFHILCRWPKERCMSECLA